MYCQPHSGILIGTLSQATLLPPPMSPHVENPHTLNWRNRESQVTTLFRFFLPLLWKLTGRPCLFFSFPSRVFPLSPLSLLFPFALLSCRAWSSAAGAEQPLPGSELGARSGVGSRGDRVAVGPCVAPPGRVSPTSAYAPAPTHASAHLHALPCQSAPGSHHWAAHCTSHGAYPSQKCEDK